MAPLPQRPMHEGLPFAVELTADGSPRLRRARVTQCALSRICGVCAGSLGRPIAFLGDGEAVRSNVFVLPPMHLECAEQLVADHGDAWEMLGQDGPVHQWEIVTTGGFEHHRAGKGDADNRPRLSPNAVIGRMPVLHR
ncbi:hypothetical protein KLP28_15605 [Nocardioidaceae bacterium]|nr:hypothetical protein KLP28_15605 [Nocardioidaceae bacterium]